MKKIAALALGLFILSNYTVLAETSEADQKWLSAVQTMVSEGKTKISTPSESRANLLKEWGTTKGYTVLMLKDAQGFTLDLRKTAAKR
jgi:hypothetical protein